MGVAFSKATWTQSARIPAPTLTEKNLPSQKGKVHIVTGGYAGIGFELLQILYLCGAKVYVAGRSADKANAAIQRITSAHPSSSTTGTLVFLHLDLSDLSTIKKSADEFLAKETRLDVLVNNAGVMFPPKGTKTVQGHDLQFGTNCLGPHLFTKFLHPILRQTAATTPKDSVRVIWASSLGIEVMSPKGGVVFETSQTSGGNLEPKMFGQQSNYGATKVGNVLLAIKTQEILRDAGVVSVSFNPGNLRTELQRHVSWWETLLSDILLSPAVLGGYTELWAGWSPDVTIEKGMTYIMPWGRDGTELVRKDIKDGIEHGGLVAKFWSWCEAETKPFA